MINVSIVTLGCSKNDVDSDQMKTLLDKEKYKYIQNPQEAEAIIVNTCGFIEQAKEESIDTILELASLKKSHRLQKLLLAGCLAQRYPTELLQAIPETDGIIGPGYLASINEALDSMFAGEKISYTNQINVPYLEGVYKDEPGISEYVKISEGCNNRCSYCIIPSLKGNNRSRKIEDIENEIRYLVSKGTREIILIGQNTTDYGIDIYNKYSLKDLLYSLRSIENLKWVRLLYAYPDNFDQELIDEIASNPKVLPYIDIPIQHISDSVLKNMNRKTHKDDIISLIENLRKSIPNIVIRSTVIVGFPGEKEEEFLELVDFIKKYPIDRLGCFTYSLEENTPAAERTDRINEKEKEDRRNRLMEVQEKISAQILKDKIGSYEEVLITEKVEDNLFIGRSRFDAPDVDGLVYVKSKTNLQIPSFIRAKITDSLEFDLVGEYNEYSK